MTRTPTPTRTPIPPTPTPTWTASPIPACSQPPGWIVYVIQRGDTLTSIASASGTTVQNLQEVNCLTNANSITVSQTIFIPGAAPTAASGWVAQGCTDPGAVITNLTPGQTVTGLVSVQGTAWLDRFGYYKIEIRPDSIQTYTLYNRYLTPVAQGELAQIDISIFTPGLYWLQLTVVQLDERFAEPCAIPLIFQR
ncbi:MAG: LysM peptidoglycan-binding domain-containing protein [Anaerolineae bacterium]|nr:LysM peptidoglycan-binding domain-containing protein [Anaerolineae bacterium]